jgi:hypothetical protein
MKDEEFVKAFSEPAPILYADPLREDTRRRLTFLLLSSIVTILVFSRVVSFTEAGFLGIKIATTQAGSGSSVMGYSRTVRRTPIRRFL